MKKAGMRSSRSSRTRNATQWRKIQCEDGQAYGRYNKPCFNIASGGKKELKDSIPPVPRSSIGGVYEDEMRQNKANPYRLSEHALQLAVVLGGLDFP